MKNFSIFNFKKIKPKVFFILSLFLFSSIQNLKSAPREFVVFSIKQSVPMGEKDEIVKKNYYLNIGMDEGLKPGSRVTVYRNLIRFDPYNSKKKFTFKVPIAKLEIIHSEDHISIARLDKMTNTGITSPLVDVEGVIIGDRVEVELN